MFTRKNGMGNKHHLLTQPFKALFHASSDGNNRRSIMQKTRRAYAKERAKQQEHLNDELASLNELLNCGSIDAETQARFKKLLEMGYERKREETREKYGFIDVSAQINSGTKGADSPDVLP